MDDIQGYSPTWISDNFPMKYLQCQYHAFCSEYIPGDCMFQSACAVRWKLRDFLDDSVAQADLSEQIKTILEMGKDL